MAERTPVKATDRYSAQELRHIARGHPPLENFPDRAGDPPVILNRDDPATTPNVLAQGTFELDSCVPVQLRYLNSRYVPPPHGRRLRCELSNLKRRTALEVQILANSHYLAEQWIDANAPDLRGRHPLRLNIDVATHLECCRTSLFETLPSIARRRNNLENVKVREYLDSRIELIDLLARHVKYFDNVYSHFASIGNKNLRGGAESGSAVTLGRIIQSFDTLVRPVSDNELLIVCFHGHIDVSMIHMDRHVMTDLFDLVTALGEMRYGPFQPTREQARTFLTVAGVEPDISPWAARLAPHRRALADRIYDRFCADGPDRRNRLRAPLIDICHAVVSGRPVPDQLRDIRYRTLL